MADPKINDKEIMEKLGGDHFVKQFAEEGQALLEETNKPNVITVEQFLPFRELFVVDKSRYGRSKDAQYTKYVNTLFEQFRVNLGINLHEVTYVVNNMEEKTIVVFLDRMFTRIAADSADHSTYRAELPNKIARLTRDNANVAIMEAGIRDLVAANFTDEMKEFFSRVKKESAVIERNFTEMNLSADKRAEIIKAPDVIETGEVGGFTLDDDNE